MKIRFAFIALVLLICLSANAAEKPPMDIPIYTGGEATMEINLTDEDLLPVLQAMLPMMTQKMGPAGEKINFDEIAAALKDLKRLQVLQIDISKTATENDIAGFYAKNLPSGEWIRIFWQKLPKVGTVAFFVQGGGEKLYGFRVQQVMVDEKPIKRVQVVKTEGKIDFTKLLTIALKIYVP